MNNSINKYQDDLTDEQKSFPDLTLLQKYDAVLEVLFDESGRSPTFDHVLGVLLKNKKKIHWGEVMDIINTMVGDNYLYSDYKNKEGIQIFLLSFNGKYLQINGGLEKKLEQQKEKENRTVRQTNASISSVNWSKVNIIAALLISITTASFVISTYHRDTKRYNQESGTKEQEKKDILELTQTVQGLKEELHQISLSLSDTAKVKVRIEKTNSPQSP